MKLIYTNFGILTEERVRELKECGVHMEECGMAGEIAGPSMRMGADYHEMDAAPPVIVIKSDNPMIGAMEEQATGGLYPEGRPEDPEEESEKESEEPQDPNSMGRPRAPTNEAATNFNSDGGSVSGPQGGNVGPQGGNPVNPGGANVPDPTKRESFNRRAEALLEMWLIEEKKKKLSKKQKKLDINKNNKLDKFDFMALRNKKKKAKKEA